MPTLWDGHSENHGKTPVGIEILRRGKLNFHPVSRRPEGGATTTKMPILGWEQRKVPDQLF